MDKGEANVPLVVFFRFAQQPVINSMFVYLPYLPCAAVLNCT